MKSIQKESLTQIGFISKPYGFKGELLFAIEKGECEDYSHSKFFFFELEGKPVPFRVEEIKMKGSDLIVKAEDVNSEEEAKKLSGKIIFIEQSEIKSAENDITWNSLIGYQLFDEHYGKLGVLEEIEEYPQHLIGKSTFKTKEILFPLNEDFITQINDEKKEIHLDLPEGLLDLYLKQ